MAADARRLLEAAVEQRAVPAVGAFVVDHHGEFRFRETCGTNSIDDPDASAFKPDTVLQIFSCTKLVTSIAALQLMELGVLSLSDSVEKYVSRLSQLQVLDSFTTEGSGASQPVLRSPKSRPTILQLLNHTAGFSYDFFDELTLQYRKHTGCSPAGYYSTGQWNDFDTPLVADPGTKYLYGTNTDWLGLVIQAASGMSLPEYIDKNILKPLGMNASGASPVPGRDRLFVHYKAEGRLTGSEHFARNATDPEIWGGGAYLYSTMDDFAQLLSALLNGGRSPVTQKTILKPSTIREFLFTDHLHSRVDRTLLGEIRPSMLDLSNQGSLMPSLPVDARGWSCGLLLNLENLPTGRKRMSGCWAGLGNLYFWIDPYSRVAGMVCTSVLPFMDPVVLDLLDRVERIAYSKASPSAS
ncbi:uncharacterized protein Z520_09163 [Fonsecaea multimorphosa CBS 102226]|uniref:Beta-lactamase-related domain-containing protein n=1 Tax=Fonsecaea multimorphosa CBS 102226 TaxID=1442371 RepID=A0A0D2IDM9_9EURO|nr:uncharacterized protein Z520_09163 [Fonsecaea multimorphosa CBS 102226]KIX95246.1 hypothetical protein Z520_09163 [Fonsecaea multimorphosa CBS 102226]